MTLDDAVKQLDALDEDALLCVRRPWIPSAECVVADADETAGIPQPIKDEGYIYFLEVNVAREVLGVFGARSPTHDEKVHLLVHYAENDAYPEWACEA